jgi:hypothetical protein
MLHFTIRDLLWLTLVGALIACWFIERLSKQKMAAEVAVQRAELAAQKAANDERTQKQWSRLLLEEAGVRDRERVVLERERGGAAQNKEVISTRTIDEKEMRLAKIEALVRHPQPGEDTLAEIADILKKRSPPKYSVPR